MTVEASEQLRRVLRLLPDIADGTRRSRDEVARLAGVKDVDALWDEFVALADRDEPGGFVADVQIFLDGESLTVLTPHFQRPMRLTMAELCALELGLNVLRRSRTPDEVAPIDGALKRLRAAITNVEGNRNYDGVFDAELAAGGSVEHLGVFRRAVQGRQKVAITYLSGSAQEATDRLIRPYMLMFSSGMWYVIAWCELSENVRIFRLDRVQQVTATGQKFDEPDVELLEKLVRERAFSGDAPGTMKIRYSPRVARWIAERESGMVEADGSLVCEHPLADLGWGVRHALQYGPEAEVLSPSELREEIARRLDAMSS